LQTSVVERLIIGEPDLKAGHRMAKNPQLIVDGPARTARLVPTVPGSDRDANRRRGARIGSSALELA
jgi:hypothetical protein